MQPNRLPVLAISFDPPQPRPHTHLNPSNTSGLIPTGSPSRTSPNAVLNVDSTRLNGDEYIASGNGAPAATSFFHAKLTASACATPIFVRSGSGPHCHFISPSRRGRGRTHDMRPVPGQAGPVRIPRFSPVLTLGGIMGSLPMSLEEKDFVLRPLFGGSAERGDGGNEGGPAGRGGVEEAEGG